jgi:regulator of replication initiation timing
LQKEFKEEVQIVSYADATLYIESAGSVYLIAFLDNEPDYELRGEINAFFADIVKRYATFFQHFDGDESRKEVEELHTQLEAFLLSKNDMQKSLTKSKSNPVKWILGTLLGIVALYALLTWWQSHRLASWEKQAQKLGITNAKLTEYNATAYRLSGIADSGKTVSRALKQLRSITKHDIINTVALQSDALDTLKDSIKKDVLKKSEKLSQHTQKLQKETYEKIASLQQRIDALSKEIKSVHNAFETLEEENIRLKRETEHMREKNRRYKALLTLPQTIKKNLRNSMRQSHYFDTQKAILNFSKLAPFLPSSVRMPEEKRRIFLQESSRYLQALCPFAPYLEAIIIEAYSDTSGDAIKNLELTQKRANYAKTLLQHEALPACLSDITLIAKGKGESAPVYINGKEDADASRRIEIGYRLDKEKIEKKLLELE